jgi:hypothetical protein
VVVVVVLLLVVVVEVVAVVFGVVVFTIPPSPELAMLALVDVLVGSVSPTIEAKV